MNSFLCIGLQIIVFCTFSFAHSYCSLVVYPSMIYDFILFLLYHQTFPTRFFISWCDAVFVRMWFLFVYFIIYIGFIDIHIIVSFFCTNTKWYRSLSPNGFPLYVKIKFPFFPISDAWIKWCAWYWYQTSQWPITSC